MWAVKKERVMVPSSQIVRVPSKRAENDSTLGKIHEGTITNRDEDEKVLFGYHRASGG